jgi:hypothetical protein
MHFLDEGISFAHTGLCVLSEHYIEYRHIKT